MEKQIETTRLHLSPIQLAKLILINARFGEKMWQMGTPRYCWWAYELGLWGPFGESILELKELSHSPVGPQSKLKLRCSETFLTCAHHGAVFHCEKMEMTAS